MTTHIARKMSFYKNGYPCERSMSSCNSADIYNSCYKISPYGILPSKLDSLQAATMNIHFRIAVYCVAQTPDIEQINNIIP